MVIGAPINYPNMSIQHLAVKINRQPATAELNTAANQPPMKSLKSLCSDLPQKIAHEWYIKRENKKHIYGKSSTCDRRQSGKIYGKRNVTNSHNYVFRFMRHLTNCFQTYLLNGERYEIELVKTFDRLYELNFIAIEQYSVEKKNNNNKNINLQQCRTIECYLQSINSTDF